MSETNAQNSSIPMFDDDDFHLREAVVKTGFSEQDDKVYDLVMNEIDRRVRSGQPWERVVKSIKMDDAELFQIILDDYLKITIAQRHFQAKEPLKKIASSLKIQLKVLIKQREAMIEEVKQASVEAYNLIQQQQNQGGAGPVQH
ncbi:MAG: hypothetical protein HQL54_10750 [Magnetococcales bacterium]|nr:hypothetical protein [Magnetococcales bacterium]